MNEYGRIRDRGAKRGFLSSSINDSASRWSLYFEYVVFHSLGEVRTRTDCVRLGKLRGMGESVGPNVL